MTVGSFRVFMRSPFLVGRLERDDYKQLVESRLAALTQRPMRLVCELAGDLTPQAPRPAPKKKPVPKAPAVEQAENAMKAMTSEERGQMEKAIAVFGNNFVPLPENEGSASVGKPSVPQAPMDIPEDDMPPMPDIPLPTDEDAPFPDEDELPPFSPEP